jgi:antitoxin HicB
MKTMSRIDEYLVLPYHVEIVYDRDDDGNEGYVASVRELAGCLSQGATPAEAAANVERAMRAWLEVALDHGDPIPEPDPDGDFSGQTVIRMPTSLHATLASRAKREKTTLNQLMISLLSGAVGFGRSTTTRPRGTSKSKAPLSRKRAKSRV